MITRPWLEFKQEFKVVNLKFKTPAHIWNICSITFSGIVSRRPDIVSIESKKLQSLHILHETTFTPSTPNHSLWNNQTLPYFCMKKKTSIFTGKKWSRKLICTLTSYIHASVWVIQVPCNSALQKSNICLLETHVLVLHLRTNVCLHISFQTPILYLLFVWWIS